MWLTKIDPSLAKELGQLAGTSSTGSMGVRVGRSSWTRGIVEPSRGGRGCEDWRRWRRGISSGSRRERLLVDVPCGSGIFQGIHYTGESETIAVDEVKQPFERLLIRV